MIPWGGLKSAYICFCHGLQNLPRGSLKELDLQRCYCSKNVLGFSIILSLTSSEQCRIATLTVVLKNMVWYLRWKTKTSLSHEMKVNTDGLGMAIHNFVADKQSSWWMSLCLALEEIFPELLDPWPFMGSFLTGLWKNMAHSGPQCIRHSQVMLGCIVYWSVLIETKNKHHGAIWSSLTKQIMYRYDHAQSQLSIWQRASFSVSEFIITIDVWKKTWINCGNAL